MPIPFFQPNGRFETQTKICLSISNHHPEHWQPSWSGAFFLFFIKLLLSSYFMLNSKDFHCLDFTFTFSCFKFHMRWSLFPFSWNPHLCWLLFVVRTALVALIAFMPTNPNGALGSLDYKKEERRVLAIKSREAPPKFGTPERQKLIDEVCLSSVEIL